MCSNPPSPPRGLNFLFFFVFVFVPGGGFKIYEVRTGPPCGGGGLVVSVIRPLIPNTGYGRGRANISKQGSFCVDRLARAGVRGWFGACFGPEIRRHCEATIYFFDIIIFTELVLRAAV